MVEQRIVIDIATNTIAATVGVGSGPIEVAITPDGSRACVLNFGFGSGSVSMIDIATNTVFATVGVGVFPREMTISHDGSSAYVTNSDSDNVSVINIATNTVTATVGVGLTPFGVAITPILTTPPSPEDQIHDLIVEVTGEGLHHGTERSLLAKLEAALAALERGDVAAACASLQDFISQVNAQDGNKLTAAQAAQYRADATALRAELGCS